MKNRYGDEYSFEKISDNQYIIVGDLKYWRFGGKEGQQRVDPSDLGFVDPSGGPFLQVGMKIKDQTIVKISALGDLDTPSQIVFDVEPMKNPVDN